MRGRMVCPECGGGSEKEKSFSYIAQSFPHDIMAGICWRASCGHKVGNPLRLAGPIARPERRHFTADTEMLDTEKAEWFLKTFGYEHPDLLYAPYLDRFIYTVRSATGRSRGVIARSFSGAKPKSLSYPTEWDVPFIGWNGLSESSYVVIVEDWVSSEKLAVAGALAVSLQGTNFSLQMATEVAEVAAGRKVILALDADAYGKSLEIALKHGAAFSPCLRVWRLGMDLKYEPVERIRKALANGELDFR